MCKTFANWKAWYAITVDAEKDKKLFTKVNSLYADLTMHKYTHVC